MIWEKGMTETRTTQKIITSNRTTPEAGRTHLPHTDGAQIRPKPKPLDQLRETLQHDHDLHSPAQQGLVRRVKPNGWIMSVLIQSVYIDTPQQRYNFFVMITVRYITNNVTPVCI
jgi:hypothetical protein